MEIAKVQATVRDQFGKGPSRRLRSGDAIPAVLYGKGMETTALSVSPKELGEAIATEYGPNRLLEIDLGGKGKHQAILIDHQYHPVTRRLLHADFKKVDDTTLLRVRVPLVLVGKAKGIILGGTQRAVYRTLPVRCLPSQIPSSIECDVTDLGVEDTLTVADLKLPDGVKVELRATQTVAGVYGNRRRAEDEEEEKKAEGAAPADAKKADSAKKADKK